MRNFSTIFLLGLIAVVGVFTLDVYLPGMPAMAKDFSVTIDDISFTFAIFSIIFAITQLFYGVISDYIGRKPILILGLTLAAVATTFCIFAKNYEIFLAARIIQAIGISAFVVVNAIIRDLYVGTIAIQTRTFVTTASVISISIAPTIGGLLQKYLSWQGGFIASLILIMIALICTILFFKESNHTKIQTQLNLMTFIKSYLKMFRNGHYITHVLSATLAYTIHFAFIIMSAKIFIELLGFSPLGFGYLMFIYGGMYFISGLFSASIAKRFSTSHLISIGGIFIFMGGIIMAGISAFIPLNVWIVLIPMTLMTIGITLIRASATTGALSTLHENAGQGAAGLNLYQFILSAIIAMAVNECSYPPQVSLSLLATLCALTILLLINLNTLTKFFHIKSANKLSENYN